MNLNMRDKDGDAIFESYQTRQQHQQLNEAAALAQAAKFLPQIMQFIKSKPELVAQLLAAVPAIKGLLGGGEEAPAPGADQA